MVDDLKKQMLRFENLIGFDGKLDVTSRKCMEKLINALSFKYKKDVQSNLRLHRLEFFYDLVESHHKKRKKQDEDNISKQAAELKSPSKMVKDEGEGNPTDEEQQLKKENDVKATFSDELVKIDAKDIDDWKDLMTLSRIYYVMEHPRSVGLVWKRRISKKKKIDKFEDRDLIEWRVSQNFCLRGLEEWAQRRSDAHRLATLPSYNLDDREDSDEDRKEMDNLYGLLDPSGRQWKRRNLLKKTPRDTPFKFRDESIEDWTESYSEDSECSYIEDFKVKTEDLTDDTDIKISDLEEPESSTLFNEVDMSELLAIYPEFSRYREHIFKQMDEAKTFEEWFKLYKKAIRQLEESKSKDQEAKFEKKMDMAMEKDMGEEAIASEKPVKKQKFEQEIQDDEEQRDPRSEEKVKESISEAKQKEPETVEKGESLNIEEKERGPDAEEKETISEEKQKEPKKGESLNIEEKERGPDAEEKKTISEEKQKEPETVEKGESLNVEKKERGHDAEEKETISEEKQKEPDTVEKGGNLNVEEKKRGPGAEEKEIESISEDKQKEMNTVEKRENLDVEKRWEY